MLALGPTRLAAVAVRCPEIGTPSAQETLDDRLGAMVVGDKDGAVAMMEHPEPPVRLADPHAGFIRGQRRAGHQPRLDQAGLRREGLPAGGKNVDQRALTNHNRTSRAAHGSIAPAESPERSADKPQRRAGSQARNGDPGSNPSGGSALKRLVQHGQTPPYKETRVTSGWISGISTRS